LKFFPPEIKTIGTLADIQDERAKLGPFKGDEARVLIITAIMLVMWTLSTWFQTSPFFNVYTVSLCGAIAMFLPGINLFSWREVQGAVGWDTLLLIMGITSLGDASSKTQLAKWLADTTFGGLEGSSATMIVLVISAFTVVIHLMLPIAPVINAVMIPPLMALATASGQNPALYALPVIFTASCAFLLPLDAVPLVTYSRGYYKFYDMWKPGLVISIIWVIVMTTAMLTLGPRLGLL
jgi:sodium-dependent dicarboxylate transporter 2/3/5